MLVLSSKRHLLNKIFTHLNYKFLNRIDTIEVICVMALSMNGTFEELLNSFIIIFGCAD